jgi:hypothetical protein
MVNGYSIRKSAKVVEINIATSFFWRHKILDCISTFLGKGYVDGVIKADLYTPPQLYLYEEFSLKKNVKKF